MNLGWLSGIVLSTAICAVDFAHAVEPISDRQNTTWVADNGNGTYSNPLFYDEFSDPDVIRVGHDYYTTGTTMHAMPGLPVLHSNDLVNWNFLGYAFDRLDFGARVPP